MHNLWSKSGSILPEVDFQLPPLLGKNVDEHFRKIAEELGSSYFKKAQMLADLKLSAIPEEWSFSPGWTKYVYSDNGPMMSSVDVPEEDALIFDVEVCINAGPFPVIAVAASSAAWWVKSKCMSYLQALTADMIEGCIQYCAKVMQTKFGEFRSLFSRIFERNFVRKVSLPNDISSEISRIYIT